MVERIVKVSDFTKLPGGRWKKDGPNSGEEFRDSVLIPAIRAAQAAGDSVVVSLDGVAGYASSFLEEVFGGVVRANLMSRDEIIRLLKVRATEPPLEGFKADALKYLSRAISAKAA